MKNLLTKTLPIAVGLALGWLLFHPPAWVPRGPVGLVMTVGIVTLLLLAFIALNIAAAIPADIKIQRLEGRTDPSLHGLIGEIKALGFEEAGGPYLVGIRPAAVLTAFVHTSQPVYATVFQTGTLPAATSYDFVSILDGKPGGLTTSSNWRGGTLPAGRGEFRQILPGFGVKQVFEAHLEGLGWLKVRGLRPKSISVESFPADFVQALLRQRDHIRKTAVTAAVVSLVRTLTRKSPEHGLLSEQKNAESQVRLYYSQA